MTAQERAYYQSVEDNVIKPVDDLRTTFADPADRDWARLAEGVRVMGIQDALAHWPLRGCRDTFRNGQVVYLAWYAPMSGCMTQGDTPEEALEELYYLIPLTLQLMADEVEKGR